VGLGGCCVIALRRERRRNRRRIFGVGPPLGEVVPLDPGVVTPAVLVHAPVLGDQDANLINRLLRNVSGRNLVERNRKKRRLWIDTFVLETLAERLPERVPDVRAR
jgi:hypothetical protein